MFEDNGFAGRLVAVPEDDEGIDIAYIEACLSQDDIQIGGNDHTVRLLWFAYYGHS